MFEIALPFRLDAYRAIYAVQLARATWVIHAFPRKSTHGVSAPKREIDPILKRIRTLKRMLR